MIKKYFYLLLLTYFFSFEGSILSAAFPMRNAIMEEPQFKKKVEAFWKSCKRNRPSSSYNLDLLKEFDLTELPFVFSYLWQGGR